MQLLTFIETPYFTKQIADLLNDEQYFQIQMSLLANPEQGDVIQGTGGIRKTRWKLASKGKSGGIRVIYYYTDEYGRIYLLTSYPKSKQEDITAEQASVLRKLVTRLKQELKNGQ